MDDPAYIMGVRMMEIAGSILFLSWFVGVLIVCCCITGAEK